MLDCTKNRQLAYLVRVNEICPIEGSDNCEAAIVNGWRVMVRKNTFKANDIAIYFEIDSLVDTSKSYFAFMEPKHGRVKTQRYTFGGKGLMISQGLLMAPSDFGWTAYEDGSVDTNDGDHGIIYVDDESRFLTKRLGVTYYDPADRERKAHVSDKYKKMAQLHPKVFKIKFVRKMMKYTWFKKFMFIFFGKKRKDKATAWPVGKFPGVNKTDQERIENLPHLLDGKTEYIRTQKCDGTSATYILERKGKHKFEFYVCSRNVRMLNAEQKSFYDDNCYWDMAIKYDIENKMEDYLLNNPDISFVCWQGEICGPHIQGNPQKLQEQKLFCFHMTDSKTGRFDIRKAADIWKSYDMDVVYIDKTLFKVPNNMEEMKLSADGYYDISVCGAKENKCPREGFVYYDPKDPTHSFKNVSREYLLNR